MSEQVVYLDNGKVVGKVINNEFVKTVKSSKHFLQKPPAIAFDISSLEDAERLGATKVKVYDTETNKSYTAPLSRIWQRGIILTRGFGEQVALRIPEWDVS